MDDFVFSTLLCGKYVECNMLVIGGVIREKNLDDLILIK